MPTRWFRRPLMPWQRLKFVFRWKHQFGTLIETVDVGAAGGRKEPDPEVRHHIIRSAEQ